ncbi:carbohydrate ABC transporter permease [Enterococcus sp. JM9B]|uniref:carbohydrate ABC transporter permease n=1 Tax=Enterococcus sp. JM9B TaxID=1857216 RepID=UPI0013749DC6|nr:carbohydrate ABC transporter permease [Enterococcus sp. JM9B]KAF1301887.1 sugar ABC transporter permease [Enterococcus sp. JM9B]
MESRAATSPQKNDLSIKIRRKHRFNAIIRYVLLISVAFLMLYPILWLVGASFKTNAEIFTSINFIPNSLDFSSYIKGWQTGTEYTFTTYFMNTFKIVIPKVLLTVITCPIVAYGFARFDFPFKKILFSLLISTLFLPGVVTRIPLYMFWKQLNFLDSYVPMIAPSLFAQEPFFVFMLIQFLRGIPKEFDEAATIDGCNSFQIFTKILLPILRPSVITIALFQFMWAMNDFLSPLIYISSVDKFPIAIALKMSMDASSAIEWNQVIAMSVISLLPSIILFFCASKQFVDGISAGGIKG